MGVINHNAIIATTWNEKEAKRIKKFVSSLNPDSKKLFLFGKQVMNRTITVAMVPDGSEEGWDESNKGDKLRTKFIKELKKNDYEDGSSPWKFVEISYGEYGQKIVQGNNKNMY